MKQIPSSTAKEQLIQINELLKKPHLLIGGLAVQQYHPPRTSSDIDLVCDDQTAKDLIEKLYPTIHFDIKEENEDDFRPAYVITSKTNNERIIFIGPKITERTPYSFINWENLIFDSQCFKFHKIELDKIRIPSIEVLAYTKLISFFSRIENSKKKGEQDLLDFVNLSNNTVFRTNFLIDLIRTNQCEEFIISRINEISGKYNERIWSQSLLFDFIETFRLELQKKPKSNYFQQQFQSFKKIFKTDNSILFYDTVADLYDERNTRFLYDGHQAIIGQIIKLLPRGGRIIDIGCGTGRLIASHFWHHENISWLGIDGSSTMLQYFQQHTQNSKMSVATLNSKIEDIDWKILIAADLCIICFTLTSLPNIDCINSIADNIKPGGLFLIADIHPARTIISPYYDFLLNDKDRIALEPTPVYPDKIIEYLLPKGFVQISQHSILGSLRQDYAFISTFRKNE